MKTCRKCGRQLEGNRKLYCSFECYNRMKASRAYDRYKTTAKALCERCGREFNPKRKNPKYCSSECSSDARRKYLSIPDCLEGAARKLDKQIGYVRVYCPMHPKANSWGYVYEHRLIMESILGRHLTENEDVHHVNGKRWDNRPENLQVMSSSEHSKIKK